MYTWLHGYGNNTGLLFLEEDPENISTELFYDEAAKKKIGDERKKVRWTFSNRAYREKEENGVVFRINMPDSSLEELQQLKETDPKKAMLLIYEKARHIQLGCHGTTIEEANEKFHIISGVPILPVPQNLEPVNP